MRVLSFFLFLLPAFVHATDKLWIPLATPTGPTVPAIKSTPDAQGSSVWLAQPTPQSTQTPVVGVQLPDGHWTYTYADGKTLESEGDYSLGQKEGVWKFYGFDGQETREMEYKDDALTGNVLLWAQDRTQKYFDHLPDMVQAACPAEFKVKTILPYWVDLNGDGDHELLVIARAEKSSVILILDPAGKTLDSRLFDGWVDDFVFGEIRKGGPLCFGYDRTCDDGLGACQWEFDTWDGTKIKIVLQYQGWFGKAGPFTLPVFQQTDSQTTVVTDNGTFQWDEAQNQFKKIK